MTLCKPKANKISIKTSLMYMAKIIITERRKNKMVSEERKKEILEYNRKILKARRIIYKILTFLSIAMCLCSVFSYTLIQTGVFGAVSLLLLIAANNFYDD